MEPIEGYTYVSVDGDPHNHMICKIVRRDTPTELMDLEPAWIVKFGDGHETTAYASELSPWYPT